MYGELVPVGGGDPIPLLKKSLLVGRRESCDIVLRFSNVSAHHCQLTLNGGYWYVKDMNSRNGLKVNGLRVSEKLLNPGDELAIAKHTYDVQYSPRELGALGPPPAKDLPGDFMKKSLLERAGLKSTSRDTAAGAEPVASKSRAAGTRYDVLSDAAGQIRDPDNPL